MIPGSMTNRPISIIRNTAPGKSPTHGGGLLDLRYSELGRPGLEPGTNPESFRGCSIKSVLRLQHEHSELRILFAFQGDLQFTRFSN
jgi:hypothetical protein